MKNHYTIPLAIIAVSILIVMGRFTVPGHGLSWPGTYEALTHIAIGSILVACFVKPYRMVAILSLVAITIFEVIMFSMR